MSPDAQSAATPPTPRTASAVVERPCAHCGSSSHAPCYEVTTARGGVYHVVRCRECDLVRLLELLSEEDYLRIYAGGTSTIHVADELTLRSYDAILARLAPFRQVGRLLEVGVGGGSFLRRAAEAGWTCFGNDVSNVSFDHLHDVIPPEHLHRGYLHQAPFFGTLAPVDVCVMLGVLEHVPTFPELLVTLRSVIRPGGALFIDVPNYDALTRRVLGPRWGQWDLPDHVTFFTPATLEAALARAGFRVSHSWTSGLNPVDLLAMVRPRVPASSGSTTPAAGGPAPMSDAYRASRVARRRRIDAIRRAVSKLGPMKQVVNRGLDAFSGGDSLYCLAVASDPVR